eukprot:m.126498 g.126498  ORF g.126498 m.126498 type:complete len:494 (+) comp17375_c0_seq1:87-1568(+)
MNIVKNCGCTAFVLVLVLRSTSGDGICPTKFEENINYPGNDLKPVTPRNVSTIAECCELCQKTENCKVFTFVPKGDFPKYDYNICWLKTSNARRVADENRTSGICDTTPVSPPPTAPPPPPTPPPTPSTRTCTTCKGPQFSWDTMPVFFHGSQTDTDKTGAFSPEAIQQIARYPIATIEKWQGSQAPVFLYEEDAMIASATLLKKANPNMTVNVWFDSVRIYTANKTLNPSAKRSCGTGHFRPAEFLETHPSYLLQNSSGLPAVEPWSGCHIYNFKEQAVRDYWKDMCLNMTASGVIDGCGADASWQTNPCKGTCSAAEAAEWDSWHRVAMRDATQAMGEGVVIGKDAYELFDHVNAVLHEGCAAAEATILTLQNITQETNRLPPPSPTQPRRRVYMCHGKGTEDEAAAFLIGAGPYQYYGFGGWSQAGSDFSGHWSPELFEPALGTPVADGVKDPTTGVWHRTFASGTTVSFDPTSNKGVINWAKPGLLGSP